MGPGYQIAQEWAKERAAEAGTNSVLDKLSIFSLPVGVRPSEELKDNAQISSLRHQTEPKAEDDLKVQPVVNLNTPWNELTDSGLEAVRDFVSTASVLLKGKYSDRPRKQGLLSVRAASMLVFFYFCLLFLSYNLFISEFFASRGDSLLFVLFKS